MSDNSELWKQTILSQYSASPIITALAELYGKSLIPDADIETFKKDVLNIDTAKSWGLDVWGRIVGCNRTFKVTGELPSDEETTFGFEGNWQNFDHGAFAFKASDTDNSTITVNDETFRRMIYIKAAVNLSNGSMYDLNKTFQSIMQDLGEIYVLPNATKSGTMAVRLACIFNIPLTVKIIMLYANILPIPAGVLFEMWEADTEFFSFDAQSETFDNGNFFSKGTVESLV